MDFYSPIHEVKFESYPSIWVKRDDLIDPFISGNKWRKLKYILTEAKAQGKNHLVTFGGAYSNHLLACAAAAARFGFTCSAFVRGEEVDNEMLFLSRLFGMKHSFVSRTDYRDKQKLFDQHYSLDPQAYFINEGGACEEAVWGCAEILDQVHADYDHIFCAAGTGTTAAGLLRAVNESRSNCKLHVVPVLKDQGATHQTIASYVEVLENVVIENDYHFGGYAKTKPDLLQFISRFTSQTGILIDHVYTGKVFYAIYDQFNKGQLKADARILAIHTGGILGLLGAKKFFPLNPKKPL